MRFLFCNEAFPWNEKRSLFLGLSRRCPSVRRFVRPGQQGFSTRASVAETGVGVAGRSGREAERVLHERLKHC